MKDDDVIPAEYTFALDGQQRLTSLLIGLRGTYYRHKDQQWKSQLDSYSKRHLHLDILSLPEDQDAVEDDLRYQFQFQQSGENRTDTGSYWWPVHSIWEDENIEDEIVGLQESVAETPKEKDAIEQNLRRLYEAIYEDESLVIEHVSNMDSEIALELFVRRNDGGETLSNSDIAFSQMAVYWESEEKDPKEAIESYVDELERSFGEYGFGFGKGFLIRSLLMLSENPPSFRREYLIPKNIRDLEDVWTDEAFKTAMDEAYRLVTEELCLGSKCLTSNSAILPIIYYCYQNLKESDNGRIQPPQSILDRMEYWLSVTVCNNLFTIGSDTVLRRAQEHIGPNSFPVLEILDQFRGRGIELKLTEERLKTLIEETDYQSGSVKHFLLTKAYPDSRISGKLVSTNSDEGGATSQIQVDHVFPQNKLDPDEDQQLRDRELNDTEIQMCRDNRHELGNLQLIPENQSKGDDDPDEWLEAVTTKNGTTLNDISTEHCLPWAELSQYTYNQFDDFCDKREELLFDRLSARLPLYSDIHAEA
jgi:hypothetical protein